MAVVVTAPYVTATGNGATTSFPFALAVRNVADVAVYVNGIFQSVGFSVTLNTDFNGGTVLFTTAPANAAAILITSQPSMSQPIKFVNSGPYNPSTVDGANDAAAIRDIFLKGLIDRAPLVPLGETMGVIPARASRIGKFFGFDAGGNPTPLSGTGNDSALRTDVAASSGASLLGWIASGIGAIARTIQDKLRETVSVTDYGADPTGVTDSLAAFNLAFATGKSLTMPEGTFKLSALPTAPTGTFRLTGAGKGKTNIIAAHNCSAGALSLAPASVNNRVGLKGFTLIAGNSGAPCQFGVIVAFPSVSSYPYRQVEIDIDFQSDLGAVAPWANTWGRGVRLTNVWYPLLNINGSSAPIVGDTGNTGFLEVTGGAFGMVGADINVIWYYGADGIRCSAYIEGLKLSSGTEFVGVTKGVYVPATTPLGGAAVTYRSAFIDIGYAHIAAGSVGIDLDTVLDLKVDRSVERWGSATGWIGLKLNQVLDPKIHCRISGNGAGVTSTGIVATGGNSAHGIVEHVHFDNLDTQFSLDGSTSHWTIRNNVSTGATADVFSLLGTNHDVEWLNVNGYIQRTVNGAIQTGSLYSAVGELGKANAAGVTYTAAELLSDAIFRSGAATVSDTTPTAAQIVAAIPGAVVGTGKRITINNQNSGVLTLVAGTGVTLVGTTTVTNAFARNYLIRITNAAPGSEAVRLIGLQTGAV